MTILWSVSYKKKLGGTDDFRKEVGNLVTENDGIVGFFIFWLFKSSLQLCTPPWEFVTGRFDINQKSTRIT